MPRTKKSSPAARTAVAYARYSSAGQRDVSIEQQLQDIRAYAAREGYTLVHEYADRAKSGYKNTAARVEFQAMLAAAEEGTFDTIIAWKVDRFGRNRRESALYKTQLLDHGVRVIYAMEPIPPGAAGILTEGMLESIAEWYSANLSENVRRGMRDNASKCKHNGITLIGYDHAPDGSFVINEKEAAVVRKIFQLYADGIGMKPIVRRLNAEGFLTNRGKPFVLNRVYTILHNEAYIGVYHYGGFRIPGGMPAIIDQKLWEEAQQMLTKTTRHHQDDTADFLLTGKLFCGHCGLPMIGDSGTSSTGATYYYYSCQGRKTHRTCDKKSIRKGPMEDTVIDFLLRHALTEPEISRIADAVMAAQAEYKKSSPLPKMEQDLHDVNRKIDNINAAIAEGIWSAQTAVLLKSLSDQAEQLRKTISAQTYAERQLVSRDRILFFLHRFADSDVTDPDRRRQLINTFINSVTVYDDHLRVVLNAVEGVAYVPIATLPDTTAPLSSFEMITDQSAKPNSLERAAQNIVIYAVAI